MTSVTAPSQSSAAYLALQAETTKPVGSEKSIDLPLISIGDFNPTLGEPIGRGDFGTIYEVRDSAPQRVYKIIFIDQFKNGDEIRISKIAGEIGAAPAFHGAYLVHQSTEDFVAIEMDYAGKSFTQWGEDLAPPADVAEVVRLSMEETLDKLYKTRETFYFELFSRIKMLADKNIAYNDSNWGNIIPRSTLNGRMLLIDFDEAELMDSPKEAAARALTTGRNGMHFNDFIKLPNLSDKSRELISWAFSQMDLNEPPNLLP